MRRTAMIIAILLKCWKRRSQTLRKNYKSFLKILMNTFDRDDYIKPKQVVVHVRHDESITKLRKTLVEHPFGTVKWSYGFHYVLCRGKEKAAAELGLSFLAYNLTRAINMVGVKRLIEAI